MTGSAKQFSPVPRSWIADSVSQGVEWPQRVRVVSGTSNAVVMKNEAVSALAFSTRAASSLFMLSIVILSLAAVPSRLGPTSVPRACMAMARTLSLALSVPTAANRKTFMTSPAVRNDIQIDRVFSAAICEAIGDRLGISLKGEPERLPQHMMMLVQQMAENDDGGAAAGVGDGDAAPACTPSLGRGFLTLALAN